jgi:hypothetical protein
VCYCDDCQSFANALATRLSVLDANGGTDIFQTSPARLVFTAGRDRLACLRVTAKGTLRWYTTCCQTPIGNTLATRNTPFVGLIHACIDPGERTLDDVLGPVRIRVQKRHAIGMVPTLDAHDGFSVGHVLGIGRRILGWRLRGDHRRSPFFDEATGVPIAEPQTLADIGPALAAAAVALAASRGH